MGGFSSLGIWGKFGLPMTIKPAYLFSLMTIVSAVFGFFLMSAVHIKLCLFTIAIYSGVTALCYILMSKTGRAISNKIGFWHFGLITIGLLLSINLVIIFDSIFNLPNPPDTVAFGSDKVLLTTIITSPLLLFSGLVVFVVGVVKALRRIKQTN